MNRILIVDDDVETCKFLAELLDEPGREFVLMQEPDAAARVIGSERFELLISDINLNAPSSGLELLKQFRTEQRGAVILISGFGTLETAIDAVRAGAFDYISKPFDIGEIKRIVRRALEQGHRSPEASVEVPPGRAGQLVGHTAPMLEVFKRIAHAADTAAPVLITGESGSGKELVARAIHEHSARAREPFVALNCGALTDTLLESELFGHARGSFTGAVRDHAGVFEQAGGGTVLLDEIGDTTPALQVRLLRVLEDNEVRPIGSQRPVKVRARVIAATNMPLERAVADGRFRQDLYYRLSVVVIHVPALRERRADIPLLIGAFLDDACRRAGRNRTLSAGALETLLRHAWPGNVRELRNTIERLVVSTNGPMIQSADLGATPPIEVSAPANPFSDLPSLDILERRYLQHVLAAVDGNRTRAAEVLGIDRRTLYRMAERFDLVLRD